MGEYIRLTEYKNAKKRGTIFKSDKRTITRKMEPCLFDEYAI